MARIRIQDENREITDVQEIRAYLRPHGIWYEKWDVEGRLPAEATNEQILETYAPEIDRLKKAGNFVTADVINVSPATPNLDALLAKFSKEHTHSEDEVRFTVKGSGVFHIHPKNGPVFGIQVESGDLINVPAGTQHWFDLCNDKTIRCIRLFQDQSGWTPHYIDGSHLHEKYTPLCLGPAYLKPATEWESVVKV
jgi:1,2-dihydroxy-3-keto-5-methylthiopentene dioxygenase